MSGHISEKLIKKNQDPFKSSEASGLAPESHAVGIRYLSPMRTKLGQ